MPEYHYGQTGEPAYIRDEAYIRAVCRIGQNAACCRYLGADGGGMVCFKHSTLKATIDGRVANGTFRAKGDNCAGLRPQSS